MRVKIGENPPEHFTHHHNFLRNPKLRLAKKISLRLDEISVLQRISHLGPEKVFEFLCRDQKIRIHLPYAATDLIQRHILRTSSFYELGRLERFRRHGSRGATIIDADANIGNHTVYFARICGARYIHAFEPMLETFKIPARNAELNAPDRIRCHNFALGASEGKADLLQYSAGNIGATRLEADDNGFYDVKALDSFQFSELHIIKMDVEGAQISVLEGARETLARHKPLIWIELLPNDIEESHEKLTSLGYDRIEKLSNTDFIYRTQGS